MAEKLISAELGRLVSQISRTISSVLTSRDAVMKTVDMAVMQKGRAEVEPYLYHLRGASGEWPDGLAAPVFEVRIVGSTTEKAIAAAKVRLAAELSIYDFHHAWLKNDDGWTVWSSAEDDIGSE